MKPTYEELEAQIKQMEADNEKALSVLKEANDAVLLAKSKFEALAAENAGLKKALSSIANAEEFHGDTLVCDFQTLVTTAWLALKETTATDAFLAEVRAHDLSAFIQHHSTELDAHIKNGGEQFDEKSVRIRDTIVSARLFREQLRKGAAQ